MNCLWSSPQIQHGSENLGLSWDGIVEIADTICPDLLDPAEATRSRVPTLCPDLAIAVARSRSASRDLTPSKKTKDLRVMERVQKARSAAWSVGFRQEWLGLREAL